MKQTKQYSRPLHLRCARVMSHATGFSLIEVLVALVVISIGMIGIASMQVQGLQFSQQAISNTRAMGLASDMADRIRANAFAADPATPASPGSAYAVALGDDLEAPTNCADTNTVELTAPCTAVQIADYDIWTWKRTLEARAGGGLPSGNGEIAYEFDPAEGFARFSIVVRWKDRGEDRSYEVVVRQ